MDDLKRAVIITALNNMMKSGHFCICTMDKCADLASATPRGSDAYNMLRALHCVDWAAMPPLVREKVPDLIRECLSMSTAEFTLEDLFDPSSIPSLSSTSGPVEPQRRSLLSWRAPK